MFFIIMIANKIVIYYMLDIQKITKEEEKNQPPI